MNQQKKIEMQDRKINSMQAQIEKLKRANSALCSKNAELLNKEIIYQEQIKLIDETRVEYEHCIAELIQLKEKYHNAISDAQQIKREYSKKIKQQVTRLKSQKW